MLTGVTRCVITNVVCGGRCCSGLPGVPAAPFFRHAPIHPCCLTCLNTCSTGGGLLPLTSQESDVPTAATAAAACEGSWNITLAQQPLGAVVCCSCCCCWGLPAAGKAAAAAVEGLKMLILVIWPKLSNVPLSCCSVMLLGKPETVTVTNSDVVRTRSIAPPGDSRMRVPPTMGSSRCSCAATAAQQHSQSNCKLANYD